MELDMKYVLHIPLSRWENGSLIPLDVDEQLNELINDLELQGFDRFYVTKVLSYYKSRKFNEVLITIFARDGDAPHEIFKNWFYRHNDILAQEAFAYELNSKMIIETLR